MMSEKFVTFISPKYARRIAAERAEKNFTEEDFESYWRAACALNSTKLENFEYMTIGDVVKEVEEFCLLGTKAVREGYKTIKEGVNNLRLRIGLNFASRDDFYRTRIYLEYFDQMVKESLSGVLVSSDHETPMTFSEIRKILGRKIGEKIVDIHKKNLKSKGYLSLSEEKMKSVEESTDKYTKEIDERLKLYDQEGSPKNRKFWFNKSSNGINPKYVPEIVRERDNEVLTIDDLIESFKKKRIMYAKQFKEFKDLSNKEMEVMAKVVLSSRKIERFFLSDSEESYPTKKFYSDIRSFEIKGVQSLIKREEYDSIPKFFGPFKNIITKSIDVYTFNAFSSLLAKISMELEDLLPDVISFSIESRVLSDLLSDPNEDVLTVAGSFFEDDSRVIKLVESLDNKGLEELIEKNLRVVGYLEAIHTEVCKGFGNQSTLDFHSKLYDLIDGFKKDYKKIGVRFISSMPKSESNFFEDVEKDDLSPLYCATIIHNIQKSLINDFTSSLHRLRELKNQNRDFRYYFI